MTKFSITKYSAICNLGNNIDEIFQNALSCKRNFKFCNDVIKGETFPFGIVETNLPEINDERFNIRTNRLLLHCLNDMEEEIQILLNTYKKDKIGVVIATSNIGVDEFQKSKEKKHIEVSNPAEFIKNLFDLKGVFAGVSTACSSGVKAFALALRLLQNNICEAVIVGGTDGLTKLPCYGFHSLEVLSKELTNPFSKNRNGINIGEGAALFILEKEKKGINVLSVGETSDAFHTSTPDPEGKQAIIAIQNALSVANLSPSDIDYINLHGTGTISNDLMEANAIYSIFKDKVLCSSTKPLTGHCLGAAGSIEAALCCELLSKGGNVFPHIYDGYYDETLPKINLASKDNTTKNINICLSASFGFGGTNAVMIMEKNNG